MHNISKRLTAVLLVLSICFSMVSYSAFSEGEPAEGENSETDIIEEVKTEPVDTTPEVPVAEDPVPDPAPVTEEKENPSDDSKDPDIVEPEEDLQPQTLGSSNQPEDETDEMENLPEASEQPVDEENPMQEEQEDVEEKKETLVEEDLSKEPAEKELAEENPASDGEQSEEDLPPNNELTDEMTDDPIWASFSDTEFVAWVTDAQNAEEIWEIMNSTEDGEAEQLIARVQAIEDEQLLEEAEDALAAIQETFQEDAEKPLLCGSMEDNDGLTDGEQEDDLTENPSWVSLSDEEFAAWVTDAQNAEEIWEIVNSTEDSEAEQLIARVQTIEDEELLEEVEDTLVAIQETFSDDEGIMLLSNGPEFDADIVSISLDRNTVNYGDTITVSVEISGSADISYISVNFTEDDGFSSTRSAILQKESSTIWKGELRITNFFESGKHRAAAVYIHDTFGNTKYVYDKEYPTYNFVEYRVDLSGGDFEIQDTKYEMNVEIKSITLDKNSVTYGDVITVSAELSGNADISYISVNFTEDDGFSSTRSAILQKESSTIWKGELRITNFFESGKHRAAAVYIHDTFGNTKYVYDKEYPTYNFVEYRADLSGGNFEIQNTKYEMDVEIKSIILDKNSVTYGDVITVSAELSESADISYISVNFTEDDGFSSTRSAILQKESSTIWKGELRITNFFESGKHRAAAVYIHDTFGNTKYVYDKEFPTYSFVEYRTDLSAGGFEIVYGTYTQQIQTNQFVLPIELENQGTKESYQKKLHDTVESNFASSNPEVSFSEEAGGKIVDYDISFTVLINEQQVAVEEDTFPPEGIAFSIPYPDGTDKSSHLFALSHLKHDGTTEDMDITLGDTAITGTAMSASPFSLLYSPAPLTGTVTITEDSNEKLHASVQDSNNTGTLRYQWLREGTEIAGATDDSYTLSAGDDGKSFVCKVTSSVQTGTISSAAIVATVHTPAPLTGTVTITEDSNEKLHAAVQNSNNTGTLSYQWLREGTEIAGATSDSYTLSAGDDGKSFVCKVTSSVQTGSISSAVFTAVVDTGRPVAPANLGATPDLNGTHVGTITGTSSTMEYSSSVSGPYTACGGTSVTGLASGTYYVRVSATATKPAGRTTAVTIDDTYSITPSVEVSGTGSISPSTTTIVKKGDSKQFTFSPASGYYVYAVYVDGVKVASSVSSYTFTNVTAKHTISVRFAYKTSNPATGDDSNLSVWFSLLTGSAVFAGGFMFVLDRRKKAKAKKSV